MAIGPRRTDLAALVRDMNIMVFPDDDAATIADKVGAALATQTGAARVALEPLLRLSRDELVRESQHVTALREVVAGRAYVSMDGAMEARLANVLGRAVAAERQVDHGRGAFNWVFEAHGDVPAECPDTDVGRFYGATRLTSDALWAALWRGVAPVRSPSAFSMERSRLDADQVEALAVRMRAVNAALLSPPTLDLAAAARRLVDAFADETGKGKPLGHYICVEPSHVSGIWPEIFAKALQRIAIADSSGCPRVRLVTEHAHEVSGKTAEYDSAFLLVVPVGDYGPMLASAIAETGRLLIARATAVGEDLERHPLAGVTSQSLVFNSKPAQMMREGVGTMAHALGLLLATRADGGLSVDELLVRVRDSGLVPQLAVAAPFGVVAPLATMGLVPRDGITFSEHGRARLPESLHALCKETRDARSLRWRLNDTDIAGQHTETLRGCPVAIRAPRATADGLVMPQHSALHELSSAFIDLLRKVYATMAADRDILARA